MNTDVVEATRLERRHHFEESGRSVRSVARGDSADMVPPDHRLRFGIVASNFPAGPLGIGHTTLEVAGRG